jgi:putative component of membrane protein insertase Oxa1/YidC/SpoIIIJ protein YidD
VNLRFDPLEQGSLSTFVRVIGCEPLSLDGAQPLSRQRTSSWQKSLFALPTEQQHSPSELLSYL